ncbi:hypothetical protein Taro_040214 [Colocasia esculenta]|uniref:Uncharacterized protein n=1 Tax=Colocasia esculenta TaxID=4460 RepID=A0A843WBA1_COLES|nr:hypothetical protein [Colocasia esculenta]
MVDRALLSRDSVLVANFPRERVYYTPTAVPSGRTRKFIRPVVRTDREAPIQNRHFDPVEALDDPLFPQEIRRRCGYGCPNIVDIVTLRFIPTPSAKELGITFRTGFGIAYVTTIQYQHSETVDRVQYRLPRLRESLAELTCGAAQSQRSEVVFNSTRDLLPRSWIWVPEHRRYSHPLRFFPTSSAKELGITFLTGIGIAYVTTIRNRHSKTVDKALNRHSKTVDKALVSRNSIPGAKFPPERVGARLPRLRESLAERTHGAAQLERSEVVFNSTLDLLPRSWIWVPEHRRYSHPLLFIPTPSSKELGITFRTGIGIAYVTTIQNRHSKTVDKALLLHRLRESLAERTRGAAQSERSEVVFNSMRDLLPRSWIWVPEPRRYSHPLRFIPTPSAKELGITFRTGIGIAYVTTIRNRHSETIDKDLNRHSKMVDKALVSRNSIPGPKFPPERVFFGISDSLDYANRWRSAHAEPPNQSDRKSCSTRCEISSPAYVTTIRNRHSETVDKAVVSRNSIPGPKFPLEHVY